MPTPKTVDDIASMLKNGQDVHLPGVGKLKVKKKPSRTARNPQTGASVTVPERNVVVFSMSSVMKDDLNPA